MIYALASKTKNTATFIANKMMVRAAIISANLTIDQIRYIGIIYTLGMTIGTFNIEILERVFAITFVAHKGTIQTKHLPARSTR